MSESVAWGWVQTVPLNQYSILLPGGIDTEGVDFGNNYTPVVGYPVAQGWNLLSIPVTPVNSAFLAIYPAAI